MKKDYICALFDDAISTVTNPGQINAALSTVTNRINIESISVDDRVSISNYILKRLSYEQRKELAKTLIKEQIVNQKSLLSHWSLLTAQSSLIDTGYIAQHLVSLQTQIAGQGMRGKGEDLCDGSEVKGANFLGSLDKNGATSPRWDFTASTVDKMEHFLNYNAIYLLSIDLNPHNQIRIRIWKVNIQNHTILRDRYTEWMKKLGYPKFSAPSHKGVNFQLFPPRNKTNDNYARHGRYKEDRPDGFSKIKIPLEDQGSQLLFHADIVNNEPIISVF